MLYLTQKLHILELHAGAIFELQIFAVLLLDQTLKIKLGTLKE